MRSLKNSDEAVSPVIGEIVLVLVVVVLAAVISAILLGLVKFESSPIPAITVHRENSTSISLVLHNYGDVGSVQNVRITSPVSINVDLEDIGDKDDEWDVGEIITLKDPSLKPGAKLVVVASVDGVDKVVLDTTI